MKSRVNSLADVHAADRKLYVQTGDHFELSGFAVEAELATLRSQSSTFKKSRDQLIVEKAIAEAAGEFGGAAVDGALEDIVARAASQLVVDDAGVVKGKNGLDLASILGDAKRDAPHLFGEGGSRGSAGNAQPRAEANGRKVIPRDELSKNLEDVATGKAVVADTPQRQKAFVAPPGARVITRAEASSGRFLEDIASGKVVVDPAT